MKLSQEVQPLLYDVKETAQMLGISERKLWSITAPRGDLPCVRIGQRVAYRKQDLEYWINQHLSVSTESEGK